MQAILTKFLGQTNTKPARIVAYTSNSKCKLVFSLTHATGTDYDNHKKAAQQLMKEMNWGNEDLIGGSVKGGYAWVMAGNFLRKFLTNLGKSLIFNI